MFPLRIRLNTQNMQANTKFLNFKSRGIYKTSVILTVMSVN